MISEQRQWRHHWDEEYSNLTAEKGPLDKRKRCSTGIRAEGWRKEEKDVGHWSMVIVFVAVKKHLEGVVKLASKCS